MLPRRGWVGWIEQHPLPAVALAFTLTLGLSGLTVVAQRTASPEPPSQPGAVASGSSSPGASPSPGRSGVAAPSGLPTAGVGPSALPSGAPTRRPSPSILPTAPAGCRPQTPKTASGVAETGITDTEVRIGQIVTDSSNLPQQLKPNYEGLAAYVRLLNAAGGICGRKIVIDYVNDNANPTAHDYEEMAQRDFAFVANSSLLDNLDYQTSPPFNPTSRDNRTGEFVPDVGGLAYSYGRSQSPWHAGVVGSLSPALIGGAQFKFFVDEAKARGAACRKAGVLYLVEPTGASEDQGRLLQVSLAQPWGGGLGSGNVLLYQASLAQPVTVYRGIVQRMVDDGVNCVFTYSDLGSSVNLVQALNQEGVWPPADCAKANTTSNGFQVVWIPLSAYDPAFVRDGGAGARCASTFLPHVPLNETSGAAMRTYLGALAQLRKDPAFRSAEPSTFSILGYASGIMFAEALSACGAAPTRRCVIGSLRALTDFSGAGMLGPVTPFRTTRATYNAPGKNYGTYDFKWIFINTVAVRVLGTESNLVHRFHRVNPASGGYYRDVMHVARGTPA